MIEGCDLTCRADSREIRKTNVITRKWKVLPPDKSKFHLGLDDNVEFSEIPQPWIENASPRRVRE